MPKRNWFWTEEVMTKAVVEVRKGNSMKLVSQKYGIPMSTLSDRSKGRSRKQHDREPGRKTGRSWPWTQEVMDLAIAEVQQGCSMNQIAAKHGIPVSTLCDRLGRRAKTRVQPEVFLKSSVTNSATFITDNTTNSGTRHLRQTGRSWRWTPEVMALAIAEVRQGGRMNHVAAKHGIPTSTLCDRLGRRTKTRSKPEAFINSSVSNSATFSTDNTTDSDAGHLRKTGRSWPWTPEVMALAITEVQQGCRMKHVAEKYGIPTSTLCDRLGRKPKALAKQKTILNSSVSTSATFSTDNTTDSDAGHLSKNLNLQTEVDSPLMEVTEMGSGDQLTAVRSFSYLADRYLLISGECVTLKSHVCPLCQSSFALQRVLETHQILEHNSQPIFTCSDCGMQFLLCESYTSHIVIHQDTTLQRLSQSRKMSFASERCERQGQQRMSSYDSSESDSVGLPACVKEEDAGWSANENDGGVGSDDGHPEEIGEVAGQQIAVKAEMSEKHSSGVLRLNNCDFNEPNNDEESPGSDLHAFYGSRNMDGCSNPIKDVSSPNGVSSVVRTLVGSSAVSANHTSNIQEPEFHASALNSPNSDSHLVSNNSSYMVRMNDSDSETPSLHFPSVDNPSFKEFAASKTAIELLPFVQKGTRMRYKCPLCNYEWHFLTKIKSHLYQHTGERNYRCNACEKTFPTASRRSNHISIKHTVDGQLRCHLCGICGKKYTTSTMAKYHEKMVHGEKSLQCPDCPYRSASKWTMKIHQRQHTGEKPCVCEHCGEAFTVTVSLRTHLKSKHGIIVDTSEWRREADDPNDSAVPKRGRPKKNANILIS